MSTILAFSDEKLNQMEAVLQALNPYSQLTIAGCTADMKTRPCFSLLVYLIFISAYEGNMYFHKKYLSLLRFIQAGTSQLSIPLVIWTSQVTRLLAVGWESHHLGLLGLWSTVLSSLCLSRRETPSSQG